MSDTIWHPTRRPRALAAAEVIASSTWGGLHAAPDGQAQLAWNDTNGKARIADVVAWRRLDQGPWEIGQHIEVTIQARAGRDLRRPLLAAAIVLELTLNPDDTAEIFVGDTSRSVGGWRFGLRVTGMREVRLLPVRPAQP